MRMVTNPFCCLLSFFPTYITVYACFDESMLTSVPNEDVLSGVASTSRAHFRQCTGRMSQNTSVLQRVWSKRFGPKPLPIVLNFIFVEVEFPTHYFVKNESVSSIQKAWYRRFPCFETFSR